MSLYLVIAGQDGRIAKCDDISGGVKKQLIIAVTATPSINDALGNMLHTLHTRLYTVEIQERF